LLNTAAFETLPAAPVSQALRAALALSLISTASFAPRTAAWLKTSF
jgi:hypothetical protein